jgi:hypothetical protein
LGGNLANFRNVRVPPVEYRTHERRDDAARAQLLQRIRSEFEEMPGLRLTRDQAARLWSLSHELSDRLLGELEGQGFLRRLNDGAYGRPDLGA